MLEICLSPRFKFTLHLRTAQAQVNECGGGSFLKSEKIAANNTAKRGFPRGRCAAQRLIAFRVQKGGSRRVSQKSSSQYRKRGSGAKIYMAKQEEEKAAKRRRNKKKRDYCRG